MSEGIIQIIKSQDKFYLVVDSKPLAHPFGSLDEARVYADHTFKIVGDWNKGSPPKD